EAVLLSFFHSGVAGHEASGLQSDTVPGVQGDQSPGQTMTDGTGLTGNTAAGYVDDDVHLAQHIGGNQGLTNDQLQGLQTEVVVNIAAIDNDGAGAVLVDANAGHRGLTTSCSMIILLFRNSLNFALGYNFIEKVFDLFAHNA